MKHTISLMLFATLGALGLTGCGTNDCSFGERCEGNVRQVCGYPDQLLGREIAETDCAATANPYCVEVKQGESTDAICVRDAETTCDPDEYDTRCEDNLALGCINGFEMATDCALRGPDCVEVDGIPYCIEAPATPCEDGFAAHCEGDEHVYCTRAVDGFVAREDCARRDLTCIEHQLEAGLSVYCGEPVSMP